MARLIYSAIASLDGYVADEHGNFGWGEPDSQVHTFINDLQRGFRTHLYGRHMYEVLVAWESPELLTHPRAEMREFAKLWQAADKIVYSKTLQSVSSAHTRIERDFDVEAIRALKARADGALCIGGPELAGSAFRAGLIDECQLFLAPVLIGDGKRSLPRELRQKLELRDQRRFASGFVYLHYEIAS